ncbi:EF hand family protein [Carpediemonas membranifera]|uniref:EF hand family protein n=1 Tax=Carpediemonas membranifera TaxID=201153 RepID=A0A8J6E090_9EUKA|nr:EF hand family protein [Carpediemonas membranifera]|eukprot:KAG9394749.1 EF hand family protein [Carpediemonas membranifera]
MDELNNSIPMANRPYGDGKKRQLDEMSVVTRRFGPASTAGFTGVPTHFVYSQTSSVRIQLNTAFLKLDKMGTGLVRANRVMRLLKRLHIALDDALIDEILERFAVHNAHLPSTVPQLPEAEDERNPFIAWERFLDGTDIRLSLQPPHTLIVLDPDEIVAPKPTVVADSPSHPGPVRPATRVRDRLTYTHIDDTKVPFALQHAKNGGSTAAFNEKSSRFHIQSDAAALPEIGSTKSPALTEDPQYIRMTQSARPAPIQRHAFIKKKMDSETMMKAVQEAHEMNSTYLRYEHLRAMFSLVDPDETGRVTMSAFNNVISRNPRMFPRRVVDSAPVVDGMVEYEPVCREISGVGRVAREFPQVEQGKVAQVISERGMVSVLNDNIAYSDWRPARKSAPADSTKSTIDFSNWKPESPVSKNRIQALRQPPLGRGVHTYGSKWHKEKTAGQAYRTRSNYDQLEIVDTVSMFRENDNSRPSSRGSTLSTGLAGAKTYKIPRTLTSKRRESMTRPQSCGPRSDAGWHMTKFTTRGQRAKVDDKWT